jgi:hypothetical protein
MVHHHDKHVLVVGNAQERRPQEWSLQEVERAAGLCLGQMLDFRRA